MKITAYMPRVDYDAINALNISKLKEMKRSPQHYRHLLANPKQSDSLALGNATHVAVLEPERFVKEFCVWNRQTDGGRMAPRSGQYWAAFVAEAGKRTILTPEQFKLSNDIAAAVRFNEDAQVYLAEGQPEVTLEWFLPNELAAVDMNAPRCAKGRVDWLTIVNNRPHLVGLKTTRDCRHFQFARQAANLGYPMQWAYYHDGFRAIKGVEPELIEICVDVDPPHAVAVYRIPSDIIEQGREEYWECAKALRDCEANNYWPGPSPGVTDLTLPSWCYKQDDDLSEMGLVE